MQKLSETIDRKFINSVQVSDFEVWTDTGWKNVSYSNKTIPYQLYEIYFDDGQIFQCADTHIFIDHNGNEIFAKDSSGATIKGEEQDKKIVSVVATDKKAEMYDLTIDSENHTYFTSGILSHNTSLVVGYILWKATFFENQTIVCLAHKHSASKEMFRRFRFAYERLPLWLKQGVIEWNKQSCRLASETQVIASATSAEAVTGLSINTLVIDECAKISGTMWEDFFNSAYPTISSSKNTEIVIVSTPKGKNHFYKLFSDAEKRKSTFVPHTIKWDDVPGRDEEFKKEKIKVLGERGWIQEFEGGFLGTENTLIDGHILRNLVSKEPIKKSHSGKFLIYEQPKEDNVYIAVVDVSEGLGKDYSTIQVIDVTKAPYRQVACYRDNEIKTNVFHIIIDYIGQAYNEALVIIENNIGAEVCNLLNFEAEYPNQFYFDRKFGIRTTKGSKNAGCSHLKNFMENGILEIVDEKTIEELEIFKKIGQSYACIPGEGNHDDLVIPLILFAYFMNKPAFVDNYLDKSKELNSLRAKSIVQIEEDMLPTGFIDDGIEFIDLDSHDNY